MNLFKKLTFALLFCSASVTSAYADNWGAIYLSKPTGIAGGSYNARSAEQAKRIALESCVEKHHGQAHDCKIAGNAFANQCMSVYLGTNNIGSTGYDGVGSHNARARAAKGCQQYGGINCKEIMTICNSRYY
ncbi:DUF4189 domain-containing protein [Pseudomonas sp. F1_0610]|uniref:DUF4189 domain-containing protein n=1 Tax=Pseudomonas sp. F1_0610 TaxID=3114284 RepID=UPI0039C2B01B